jgi:hypothetical protein
MSDRHSWCHGTHCHEKRTQDRVRGVKGSKVLRTKECVGIKVIMKVCGIIFVVNTCLTDYINEHLQAFIRIAPRREPLETPIEVKKVQHPAEEYNWGTRPAYTETVIESVERT